MLVSKVFFIILMTACHTRATINPYGPTVINDFTNCINEIVEREFKKPGLLMFANTNNVSTTVSSIRTELLKKFGKEMIFSVQVLSPSHEMEICDVADDNLGVLHMDTFQPIPLADYFLIIVDTYKDFSHLASKLIRSRSWNPHAKFIVLIIDFKNTNATNIKYAEKIFTCMFKYNVINIITLTPEENKYRHAIIYSWMPYDPPKYCGYFNETAKHRLKIIDTCDHGTLKNKNELFPSKIRFDMKGCIITIFALQRQPFISKNKDDANIERLLVNEMLERFDIEAEYRLINGFRGEREDIGEWNGGLRKLASKSGHLLLGGVFPDFDVHEDFENSITYLADAYTWVVPRAPKLPPWASLLIIFENVVWFSAIAGFFICAVTWRIIGQLSGDSLYNSLFDHCFMNTWISMLGFVTYVRPIKESLRVFYVFLNIYCILFLTTYQMKLFDVLTNPSFEFQIQTVEELVESGLKFGGSEELHDLFYNSSDPFDYYVGDQWIDVYNLTQAMIDVAVHRNFSVLCSRLELAHLSAVIPELSDRFGNFKYYAFEQNTFTTPIETIGLKGFPYMKEFSNTITLFKQSGINEAIRKSFVTYNNLRRAKLLRSLFKEKYDINALSLKHLQGGFLALVLGYVSGTLVLIAEIVSKTNYFQKHFHRRR